MQQILNFYFNYLMIASYNVYIKHVLAAELSRRWPKVGANPKQHQDNCAFRGRLEVIITLDKVNLHSMRLFCRGVPVSITRLLVLTAFNAFEINDPSLRRICPSSHTTKSGPEKKINQ